MNNSMYSADQNVKSSLAHLSRYFCSRSFFPGLATKLLHRSMLSRFSQYLYNYSLTLRMWDADSIQNHLKVRRTHLSYHVTAPRLAWAWPSRLVPTFLQLRLSGSFQKLIIGSGIHHSDSNEPSRLWGLAMRLVISCTQWPMIPWHQLHV